MTVPCPACGGVVADTALQCVHCGAVLRETFAGSFFLGQRAGKGRMKYARPDKEAASKRVLLTAVLILGFMCAIPYTIEMGWSDLTIALVIACVFSTITLLRGKA